jgi:tRNA threonylcarbamoyladenosine biosynthesis protein TsaB
MTILAIDTSTQWCSVALCFSDGQNYLRHEKVGNKASQVLLDWVHDLMSQSTCHWSDISSIAVSQGPGGFTGIRLGMGVAQGLAYSLSKPLIPITSLDGMIAYQRIIHPELFSSHHQYHVLLDARMAQVYRASYQILATGALQRIGNITLLNAQDIKVNTDECYFCYDIDAYLESQGIDRQLHHIYEATPHALGVGFLATLEIDSHDYLPKDCQPLYVRDQVALTIAQRSESDLE